MLDRIPVVLVGLHEIPAMPRGYDEGIPVRVCRPLRNQVPQAACPEWNELLQAFRVTVVHDELECLLVHVADRDCPELLAFDLDRGSSLTRHTSSDGAASQQLTYLTAQEGVSPDPWASFFRLGPVVMVQQLPDDIGSRVHEWHREGLKPSEQVIRDSNLAHVYPLSDSSTLPEAPLYKSV